MPMLCATVSCISRAIRSRSAVTAWAAAWALSISVCSRDRRTDRPTSQAMTATRTPASETPMCGRLVVTWNCPTTNLVPGAGAPSYVAVVSPTVLSGVMPTCMIRTTSTRASAARAVRGGWAAVTRKSATSTARSAVSGSCTFMCAASVTPIVATISRAIDGSGHRRSRAAAANATADATATSGQSVCPVAPLVRKAGRSGF